MLSCTCFDMVKPAEALNTSERDYWSFMILFYPNHLLHLEIAVERQVVRAFDLQMEGRRLEPDQDHS